MKKRFLVLSLVVSILASIFAATTTVSYASGARGMCVMEKTTGRVLASSNMNSRLPMASTTKILTAIAVIENTDDLELVVKVPDKAIGVEGSSIYLVKDEELKIIDLLYGLMLQSGNDCATALAIVTSGSVEAFAELMNQTAINCGAENSNFTNPHGLPDDNHFTTAYDLALISCYAMRNPIFSEIVGTKSYRTTWKDRDYGRVINNKNKILNSYEGGTGVKTGFTKKAGRCLVASSLRDGMEVIAVVLNCGDMFGECKALMTQAHNTYKMVDVARRGEGLGTVAVERSRTTEVAVGLSQTVRYPLKAGELESINIKTDLVSGLCAPVKIGHEVGISEIYLGNQLLFTQKAYTIEEARSLTVHDRLVDIIGEWNK